MSKKIVKLNGGLGNQMFQYAFAVALGRKWQDEVLFDFSYFKETSNDIVVVRPFELGIFNTDCKPASDEDLTQIIDKSERTLIEKVAWDWFKIKKYKPATNILRQSSAYIFEKKFLTQPDAYYYDGYFQNEKYFKHCRSELLQHFSLKESLGGKCAETLEQIKGTNSVSIHVRRGDYVTLESANTLHGLCSLEYYKQAIEYIAKKVPTRMSASAPSPLVGEGEFLGEDTSFRNSGEGYYPHFFLFSDDVEWVVQNLKIDYPYTVVDFNQDNGFLDMELMKNCKHNIVANSSFSWWGAWLNENPEKIVVAPKKWLAINEKCDIVPSEWVKL